MRDFFGQVAQGTYLAGFVTSVKDFGVFVRFPGGLSALAPRSLLSDSTATSTVDTSKYPIGLSVWAFVQSVDPSAKRLLLNLKPSVIAKLTGESVAPVVAAAGKSAPVASKQGPIEGVRQSASKESKHAVAASALCLGGTVQCRVESSGTEPAATTLAVVLLGVTGRYKARLGLAECCDVCPLTGAVANSEGVATFRKLADCTPGSAPIFRAKVVALKTGKVKENKKHPERTKDAVVEIELSVSVEF